MNKLAKVIAASVLLLAGAVPAFAAHNSKMGAAAHPARAERVQTHRATDAMAYTPADASTQTGPDFGIGSQR